MLTRVLTLSVLFMAGTVAPLCAQGPEAGPAGSSNSGPEVKLNPLTVLRNFEPPVDEEYRLGSGDAITIDFAGRPEMQAKLVVGPDGRISLPMAGDVKIADLSRSEAAAAIETALNPFYANLAVQVTVTQYTSNRILLLGAVEHPGVINFDRTPTLLEAVTRGGTLQPGTSRNGQLPEQCTIYRGRDQVVWVNLRELVEGGNALADMRLRRDDVVYVPNALERFISVLGEVQHPGPISLNYKSTLASLLAEAGGLTDRAGRDPNIQIVDPATGTTRVIHFKDAISPTKALEVQLKPGQIIFIPKSGFNKVSYVLEHLGPMSSVMSAAFYSGVL